MMIKITGQHFINNAWLNNSDEQFTSVNPHTDSDNPWSFYQATENDVNLALACASEAFVDYRRKSTIQRATFLEAIAQEIEKLGSQLVEVAMSETALPQMRIEGERGRTCAQLRLFSNNLRYPLNPVYIDRAQANRQPLPKADSRLTQIPLGPVVVFGASNFPLAFSTAGGDTASALAAGCPVIVKGHPAHPATTELVCHAISHAVSRCGMPNGIFTMLQSSNPGIAQQLVQAPAIKAVGFTGSQKVGDILASLIQQRDITIPFYGELGSINPQFILPNILANKANELANNQVDSMLMGHGQFCTSPGLVVVEKNDGIDQFVATLETAIAATDPGTMLTRGICQAYQSQVKALADKPHINHIGSGKPATGQCQSSAVLYSVDASDFIADSSLQDETFGPCALIVLCDSSTQLHQVSQMLNGQLTASIHGLIPEINNHIDLIDNLSQCVGRLIFNQMPTGVEVCHSMQHGGPYPASTAPNTTSVGSQAIARFTRPICFQNMPSQVLPDELKDNSEVPQIIV